MLNGNYNRRSDLDSSHAGALPSITGRKMLRQRGQEHITAFIAGTGWFGRQQVPPGMERFPADSSRNSAINRQRRD